MEPTKIIDDALEGAPPGALDAVRSVSEVAPRIVMSVAAAALVAWGCLLPDSFASAMQALDSMPTELWAVVGTIVVYLCGGDLQRAQHKHAEKVSAPARGPAGEAGPPGPQGPPGPAGADASPPPPPSATPAILSGNPAAASIKRS